MRIARASSRLLPVVLALAPAAPAQGVWRRIDGPSLSAYPLTLGTFAAMCLDRSRDRLVLRDGTGSLFERGRHWSDRGADHPGAMLHDPVAGRLLLETGTATTVGLTAWDGDALVALPGVMPRTGSGPVAFDAGRNRAVKLQRAGTGQPYSAHEWDGAQWLPVAPMPFSTLSLLDGAYDPTTGRLMFLSYGWPAEIVSWDGASWRREASTTGGWASLAGVFHNPATNRLEAVGVRQPAPGGTCVSGLFTFNPAFRGVVLHGQAAWLGGGTGLGFGLTDSVVVSLGD